MAGNSFGIKGTETLIKSLQKKSNLSDVKKIVQMNGAELQREIQRNAVFKGHYRGEEFIPPTGATKRSVQLWMEDNGFTAKSGPTTYYSWWLEYGSRYMTSQPFVQPAFMVQKVQFIKDLERLMK